MWERRGLTACAALATGVLAVGVLGARVPPRHALLFLVPAVILLLACRAAENGEPAMRGALRLASLLLLFPLLGVARRSAATPALSLMALALGVGLIVTLRHAFSDAAMPPASAACRRGRLLTTGAVFVLAIAAGRYQLSALSTPLAPDTATYWSTIADLFAPLGTEGSIRTPLYSLVFAVVHGIGGNGHHLIALQLALRAVGCAGVAWLLGRTSVVAASLVGGLLALDPVSAAASTSFLSEGLYTTGLVLSLAVVIGQMERHRTLRAWQLFAAGLVFGWAFLFRPNGAALIVPVVLAYWVAARSWQKTLLPLGGFALVAVALAVFNLLRTGTMMVAATGLYFAFPLFSQQLFDPGNGPVSAEMHRHLTACYPQLDYGAVRAMTSNEYIHGKFSPCLMDRIEGGRPRLYAMYGEAYREAIRARPITFAWRMVLESMRFLATTVSYYPAEVSQFAQLADFGQLCRREGPFQGYQRELIAFVCPLPESDVGWREGVPRVAFATRMLYQPYLYTYQPHLYLHGYHEARFPELSGAAGLCFFLLAVCVVPARYRFWVAGAALLVLYGAVATALGQVTILRYVAVTSPFLLLVSGLFLVSVVEEALEVARRRRRPAPEDPLPGRLRAEASQIEPPRVEARC